MLIYFDIFIDTETFWVEKKLLKSFITLNIDVLTHYLIDSITLYSKVIQVFRFHTFFSNYNGMNMLQKHFILRKTNLVMKIIFDIIDILQEYRWHRKRVKDIQSLNYLLFCVFITQNLLRFPIVSVFITLIKWVFC